MAAGGATRARVARRLLPGARGSRRAAREMRSGWDTRRWGIWQSGRPVSWRPANYNDYAVKLLGGCAYATGEMRQKLRRRAARAEDVEATLGRLKEHGYLDDDRFASGYAAARLENGGLGARRVLRDLAGRRVAPATAPARGWQNLCGGQRGGPRGGFPAAEIPRSRRVARSRKGPGGSMRRLLRAGFAPDTAMRVLKRFAKKPRTAGRLRAPRRITGGVKIVRHTAIAICLAAAAGGANHPPAPSPRNPRRSTSGC